MFVLVQYMGYSGKITNKKTFSLVIQKKEKTTIVNFCSDKPTQINV